MKRYCCLHGFGGAGRSFDRLRALLEGYAVGNSIQFLSPDLAGHGFQPGNTTFEAEVERLLDLIAVDDDQSMAPWHLVGYSLGGRLALGMATAVAMSACRGAIRPNIARVTLIGANPGLGNSDERRARALADDRWADRIEEEGVGGFFERWRALPLFASQNSISRDLLAEQERINLGHDPLQLAGAMRGLSLGRMPNYSEQLGLLTHGDRSRSIATDWLAGSLDAKFTRLAQEAAVASGGRFVGIEGVGHNVLLEAAARVAEVIVNGVEETE